MKQKVLLVYSILMLMVHLRSYLKEKMVPQ